MFIQPSSIWIIKILRKHVSWYLFYIPGYSHGSNYSLFHLGETASSSVQEFAESGSTNSLENEAKNTNTTNATISHSNTNLILDGFTAPPIDKGVGISEANVFLDGNHSMVSK